MRDRFDAPRPSFEIVFGVPGRAAAKALVAAMVLVGFLPKGGAVAQTGPAPRLKWSASWISHPTAPLREPIVLHFKKQFEQAGRPEHFIVHVSADNRYVLYLNGQRIGDGPARGDLTHWRYATYDLAPLLKDGVNVLAATVWNFGIYAPMAQISDRTAFLLEGDGEAERAVNTDASWLVEEDTGRMIWPRTAKDARVYMAVGPGEALDASRYDWEWWKPGAASGHWVSAAGAVRESVYEDGSQAAAKMTSGGGPWALVPDALPPMTYAPEAPGHVVRTDIEAAKAFPRQPAEVPGHAHVHILLDRSELTTGYPVLKFSGGRGACIRLTYAEALYDAAGHKDNRNEVGDRQALGIHDEVLADGGQDRIFEPLWWRTWRYLDLEVSTQEDPLRLEGLETSFTGYPYKKLARFESDDPGLDKIWDIGWHGVELASHETFMDTPYYEELQYAGDSRIEAMIAYAVTGDDRLPQEAIRALNDSRLPEGITQSRYPSHEPQLIPPFSLLWIGMVHDAWMYRPDTGFIREMLPGTRTVLDWFAGYQQPDGLLQRTPWWNFVDWTPGDRTLVSFDEKDESCLMTLHYVGALEEAIAMEGAVGDRSQLAGYSERLKRAKSAIYRSCWDIRAGLVADTAAKESFSQQTNTLAVLYDVIPAAAQADVMKRILRPRESRLELGASLEPALSGLVPASYYFRFYVARALDHAGLGDLYLGTLTPWREMLKQGFTAWPEVPVDSRSDSHAWSAHPTFDLLTTVAGIQPGSPGFGTIKIEPHLGMLHRLEADYPHPLGLVGVQYIVDGERLIADIHLPEHLEGTFRWRGHSVFLHQGKNHLLLNGGAAERH